MHCYYRLRPSYHPQEGPKQAFCALAKGNEAYKEGNLGDAVRHFNDSLSLAETDGYAFSAGYNNLGVALATRGSYGMALLAFRAAIDNDPEDPDHYWNLGHLHLEMGASIGAIDAFSEMVALESGGEGLTWLSLAQSLHGVRLACAGDLEAARMSFDFARQNDASNLVAKLGHSWASLCNKPNPGTSEPLAS